ncbi:MAG: hypothetical protein ACFFCZ_18455 [Promethearchaeota archaeon]
MSVKKDEKLEEHTKRQTSLTSRRRSVTDRTRVVMHHVTARSDDGSVSGISGSDRGHRVMAARTV